jgi:hypothetical protein
MSSATSAECMILAMRTRQGRFPGAPTLALMFFTVVLNERCLVVDASRNEPWAGNSMDPPVRSVSHELSGLIAGFQSTPGHVPVLLLPIPIIHRIFG